VEQRTDHPSAVPLRHGIDVSGSSSARTRIEQEQWEALYREAFTPVYRAVVAVTLNADDALDALHDAFLEGLRRPPAHSENLAGWLFRVAVRNARHSVRRRLRLVGRLVTMNSSSHVSAEEDVLNRLEASRLLAKLTQRQREVVVAKYLLDMTQDEIAEMLELKRGTVGATIRQAFRKMRGDPDAEF
jgi:RNA polymerase sigma factor (sigma-70 family)